MNIFDKIIIVIVLATIPITIYEGIYFTEPVEKGIKYYAVINAGELFMLLTGYVLGKNVQKRYRNLQNVGNVTYTPKGDK